MRVAVPTPSTDVLRAKRGRTRVPAAAAVLLYRVILFWIPLVMGLPAFVSLRRGLNDPPT